MSRSGWRDGFGRNRGREEVNADRRHRAKQLHERAKIDREARTWSLDDQEVVIPDGTDLRPAPAFTQLGDLLGGIVRARGWEERLHGVDLDARWREIVGPQLAERSAPGRLAGGILQVLVDDPRWATQVRFMTEQIAGRVAAVTGTPVREVTVSVVRQLP